MTLTLFINSFHKRKKQHRLKILNIRPSIFESSFIVILQLQTEMPDAVDISIISKF